MPRTPTHSQYPLAPQPRGAAGGDWANRPSPAHGSPQEAPPSDAEPLATTPTRPGISHAASLRLGRSQAVRDVLTSLPLVAVDALMAWSAGMIALQIHPGAGIEMGRAFPLGMAAVAVLLQQLHGLYPACGMAPPVEFRRVLKTAVVMSLVSAFFLAAGPAGPVSVAGSWMLFCILFTFLLAIIRPLTRRCVGRFDRWAQPVAVVGQGPAAARCLDRLQHGRHGGLRPVGLVFDPAVSRGPTASDTHHSAASTKLAATSKKVDAQRHEYAAAAATRIVDELNDRTGPHGRHHDPIRVASVNDLEAFLLDHAISRVVVADRGTAAKEHLSRFQGVPHVVVPADLGLHPSERIHLVEADGGTEMHCEAALTRPHALAAKRLLEFSLVLLTLPLSLPVLAGLAVAIRLTSPGPAFYTQSRVGRGGRLFTIYKFRSMVRDADRALAAHLAARPDQQAEWTATHKLKHDPRVTRIGRFLRKTSLDELPQLINVLRGDMALVGPRPIIDAGDYDREYIQDHPDVFAMYQRVRPGITGLWQVSGRNTTAYRQRIHLDRVYLQNWSITLDLFVLWRTVKTALLREGAC